MPTSTSPSNTPFGKWDIGGCNCATSIIQVEGCTSQIYPGVTVSVYASSGGTLLYSGTTDSLGQVHATVGTGSYWVTITGQSARFAAYAQTLSLVAGGTTIAHLAAAAGYVCLGLGCLQPTTTTLNYSGPQGAHALVWNGVSEWVSSDGVVALSVGATPSTTHLYYNGSLATTCSSYSCPPSPTLGFIDGSTVTE